jgi:two-component system nitrate/nitrite response regulator NarL
MKVRPLDNRVVEGAKETSEVDGGVYNPGLANEKGHEDEDLTLARAEPQIGAVDTDFEATIARHRNARARVVIYSDQPILANGLGSLIAADPALELNACCANLSALKEHLAGGNPDVAVLDLTLEITIATLSEFRDMSPECRLILWVNSIASDFALEALTFGIRGVLRKSLSLEAHRQCLHRVYSGDLWFEKSLMDSFRAGRRVLLTPREGQLVAMLSRGLKNKAIAFELGLTEGTVKVYLSQLLRKSGANDRFDLALRALKNLNMAGAPAEGQVQGELRSLMIDPLWSPGAPTRTGRGDSGGITNCHLPWGDVGGNK